MSRNTYQNNAASVIIKDLSDHVTEDILYELMLQAGPLVSVNIPKNNVTQRSNGYGFAEFRTEEDARYAETVFNGVRLFGQAISVSMMKNGSQEDLETGAKLYIGNLSPNVTDMTLYSCFKNFGELKTCKVVTDIKTQQSMGYGFVSYSTFEAADKAKKMMNGQFVGNSCITVSYAFKENSKRGEKHGDQSERKIQPNQNANANMKKYNKIILNN